MAPRSLPLLLAAATLVSITSCSPSGTPETTTTPTTSGIQTVTPEPTTTQTTSPEPSPPGMLNDIPGEPTQLLRSLIGLDATTAEQRVNQAGYAYRITRIDGRHLTVTMDYSADRINVEIAQGRVTHANIG